MYADDEEIDDPTPDWKLIFYEHFQGGSTRLKSDQTFHSLVGLPEDVITVSYYRYGSQVRCGLKALSPLNWMIFLSYLRTSASWDIFSLLWRRPVQTLRDMIKSTISQLDGMVDEVRSIFTPKNCIASY